MKTQKIKSIKHLTQPSRMPDSNDFGMDIEYGLEDGSLARATMVVRKREQLAEFLSHQQWAIQKGVLSLTTDGNYEIEDSSVCVFKALPDWISINYTSDSENVAETIRKHILHEAPNAFAAWGAEHFKEFPAKLGSHNAGLLFNVNVARNGPAKVIIILDEVNTYTVSAIRSFEMPVFVYSIGCLDLVKTIDRTKLKKYSPKICAYTQSRIAATGTIGQVRLGGGRRNSGKIISMKLTLNQSNDTSTGTVEIESPVDHSKLYDIVVNQANHDWEHGILARRAQAHVERERRSMQAAAANDPDLRERLEEEEQQHRELLASLEEDPDDSDPRRDVTQQKLREEMRAKIAREHFGADLPGAHRDLIGDIEAHSNGLSPGRTRVSDVPYSLPLIEDSILVLAELGKAWLANSRKEGSKQDKVDRDPEALDEEAADNNPLRELEQIFGRLDSAATGIREKKLEKMKVKTRVRGRRH